LRKQPTTDEGAYDSNDDIADDPEPGALHDLTGQPSGNQADQQDDQKTFTGHVHLRILQIRQTAEQIPTALRNERKFKEGLTPVNIRLSRAKEETTRPAPVTLRGGRGEFCSEVLTSGGLPISMSNFERSSLSRPLAT
jgi:hypothetical protein